jgi:very-short-patch-repair endonuclease
VSKLPKPESPGEAAFALHCRAEGLSPEREYVFAAPRKWRFDAAFVPQKVAVEIEGGTWSGGRHTRGSGFSKDCAKYNQAAKDGWLVLRYTTEMVLAGDAINDVLEVLKGTR